MVAIPGEGTRAERWNPSPPRARAGCSSLNGAARGPPHPWVFILERETRELTPLQVRKPFYPLQGSFTQE